ncbi:hypothetical protein TNCV_2289731 [Trichonephila clavipes]|uniref:Uncharacterized protein n=1 Tax=Trichonephila clavipes TaxID=2585209 RepID=A0A8X6RJE5_TRICX|nr:hypothetical protein TNCV_2289731 [Trichonephila clavipes]
MGKTYTEEIQDKYGSRVVKAWDRGWPCHELEPSTTKDSACRETMHVKSVEAQTSSRWCGMEVWKGEC